MTFSSYTSVWALVLLPYNSEFVSTQALSESTIVNYEY